MGANEALSPRNHRLKHLRKLVSQSNARKDDGVLVVEGPNLVAEALSSGLNVREIYVEDGPALDKLLHGREALDLGEVELHIVVPEGLKAILSTVSPQPVVAIVERPQAGIADLAADKPVLVLIEGRDPGNVGTLFRTAEAAGFAGVVLGGASVDSSNPKVVRAAAGASFRLPIVEADSSVSELFTDLRDQDRSILATTVTAESATPHDAADLRTAAIVLGNEAHGLDPQMVALADNAITIELAGPTESLNVAAAGAVLCFEALRQMRQASRPDPLS